MKAISPEEGRKNRKIRVDRAECDSDGGGRDGDGTGGSDVK
jgi:hypothetical protein